MTARQIEISYYDAPAQQASDETIIRLFRRETSPTIQPALHQAYRVQQQSTIIENFHQVVLPPTISEVPCPVERTIEDPLTIVFKLKGSFDLVAAQVMVISQSWLRNISFTIFLPPDADLLRGLIIKIARPVPTNFTTIRYRCAGLQNGPTEILLQANRRISEDSEPTVCEYVVAPIPRISIYRPRGYLSAIRPMLPGHPQEAFLATGIGQRNQPVQGPGSSVQPGQANNTAAPNRAVSTRRTNGPSASQVDSLSDESITGTTDSNSGRSGGNSRSRPKTRTTDHRAAESLRELLNAPNGVNSHIGGTSTSNNRNTVQHNDGTGSRAPMVVLHGPTEQSIEQPIELATVIKSEPDARTTPIATRAATAAARSTSEPRNKREHRSQERSVVKCHRKCPPNCGFDKR